MRSGPWHRANAPWSNQGDDGNGRSRREEAWFGGFAKGPSEPFRLTPQQQREVRARLEEGEPQDNVARSYGVDVDTIKRVGARFNGLMVGTAEALVDLWRQSANH